MTPETKAQFDKEVESWIAKGWLKPYEGDADDGIIPLMAVVQANKNKVRPVMDFRELNEFVECHLGTHAAACDKTVRRWRHMREPLKVLDLKSAYLKIHIDSSLWPFQQVYYRPVPRGGRTTPPKKNFWKSIFSVTISFSLNSTYKVKNKSIDRIPNFSS